MSVSTFLVIFVQTGLSLLAALIILKFARYHANVRVMVSRLALMVSLTLLVLGSLFTLTNKPVVPVQIPEVVAFSVPITNAKSYESTVNSAPAAIPATGPKVEPQSSQAPAVYQSVSTFTASRLVIIAYEIGLLLALLPIFIGSYWLARTRRNCQRVTSGSAFELLTKVANQHQVKLPMLYAGSSVTIPFVAGLIGKQVYIPLDWVDCDDGCSAVLEHEVAHIVSGDLGWKFFCRIACACLWFQPLAWVVFRNMCHASEERCDQSVLRSGFDNSTYATTLLNIREAAKRSRVPGIVIGAVGRESNLSKRLHQIMATDVNRMKKVSRGMIWAAIGMVLLMAATSALVFGQPALKHTDEALHGSFAGKIMLLDHNRQPLLGATAKLYGRRKDETATVVPLVVTGSTVEIRVDQANGFIQGSLVVQTKEGMQDFKMVFPAVTKPVEFQLAKPSTIRGKLILPFTPTAPLQIRVPMMIRMGEGSAFNAEALFFPMFAVSPKSVSLNSDGTFEMTEMPSNSTVCLEVDDDHVAADSMAMRVTIDKNGVSKFFEHTMNAAGIIEGKVLRNGRPFAGLKIAAQGQNDVHGPMGWAECVTDSLGHYRLSRLSASVYNVAANIPEDQRTDYTMAAKEGLSIKAGETRSGVDFEVVPGGIISGTVATGSGKVLPNVSVGIYGPAHPRTSAWVQGATTDAKGHFRARVPAGTSQVYYMGAGEGNRPEVTVEVKDGMESKVQVIGFEPGYVKPQSDPNEGEKMTAVDPSVGPIKMKNGGTATLEAVFERKGSVVKVWKPDGSTHGVDPNTIKQISTGFVKDSANGRQEGAFIRLTNLAASPERYFFKTSGILGSSDNGSLDKNTYTWVPVGDGKKDPDDVSLGVSFGPLKPIYQGSSNSKHSIKTSQNGKRTLTVSVPRSYAEKDLLLKVMMSDKRNFRMMSGGFKVDGAPKADITYKVDLRPEIKVESVEVSYRDVEWVTFKGVHLKPN